MENWIKKKKVKTPWFFIASQSVSVFQKYSCLSGFCFSSGRFSFSIYVVFSVFNFFSLLYHMKKKKVPYLDLGAVIGSKSFEILL